MKRYSKLLGTFTQILVAVLTVGPLSAADTVSPLTPALSSPVLGYAFDESAKAIRTISGVPGAASLGESVQLPVALSAAYVHSGARVALGTTKEGELALIAWGSGTHVTPIETELTQIAQVAFSRSGGRMALTDGATVETWSTSGAAALLSRQHFAGGIKLLAVNSEGVVAAATLAGVILRLAADDTQSIATGGDWSALAFSSNGADVIAVDATLNELVRISGEGGRAVLATLPESASAIAVAEDGEHFAATLSTSLVLISAAGAVRPVACDCQPKGLDGLQGGLVVYVRGTALVLDADTGEPRLTSLPTLFAVNAGGTN